MDTATQPRRRLKPGQGYAESEGMTLFLEVDRAEECVFQHTLPGLVKARYIIEPSFANELVNKTGAAKVGAQFIVTNEQREYILGTHVVDVAKEGVYVKGDNVHEVTFRVDSDSAGKLEVWGLAKIKVSVFVCASDRDEQRLKTIDYRVESLILAAAFIGVKACPGCDVHLRQEMQG
ncbi:uncharacterized protein SPSK_02002 [Sporothrix schenckii 1099-18]|uniref:Uncharacterized protein n=1 Tax=Sporothrix schenckii 1099-18 TaxID=1397361 RepID=A0A0F2MCA0_SPOSC|nr:uncharacterized protein SPSK_02002 [Sporothrix schenckii 1099-18]KJR87272.1 hypothetical protein SPSK_02002 [Sporothrix schenckii 1099-18]